MREISSPFTLVLSPKGGEEIAGPGFRTTTEWRLAAARAKIVSLLPGGGKDCRGGVRAFVPFPGSRLGVKVRSELTPCQLGQGLSNGCGGKEVGKP